MPLKHWDTPGATNGQKLLIIFQEIITRRVETGPHEAALNIVPAAEMIKFGCLTAMTHLRWPAIPMTGACALARNITTAPRLRANAGRPQTAKKTATMASARAETTQAKISKGIRVRAAARLAKRGSAVSPGSA